LVRAYRDRNFRVVANSRSIRQPADPDILAVAGDITDSTTAKRIVSQAIDRFGRVDTLVNNAGIFIAKPFAEYTDEDYANQSQWLFHVTRRAAKEMLKRGSGHIVQITTSLDEHAVSRAPPALAALTKGGLSSAGERASALATLTTGAFSAHRLAVIGKGLEPARDHFVGHGLGGAKQRACRLPILLASL
jgi:NAD(P)-dependent dehydrogenase (short-subunit alcohol dehydrogenase family)